MIAAVTGGRDLCITPELACAFWAAIVTHRVTVLRHGACRGADTWAAASAKAMGLVVEAWPADWDKHGRSAGPIRNRSMLSGTRDTPHAQRIALVDLLLTFPGGDDTADCCCAALDFGVRVVRL